MDQIGSVLVNLFLQIGNNAGQLGALILQTTNDKWFSHGMIPLSSQNHGL